MYPDLLGDFTSYRSMYASFPSKLARSFCARDSVWEYSLLGFSIMLYETRISYIDEKLY